MQRAALEICKGTVIAIYIHQLKVCIPLCFVTRFDLVLFRLEDYRLETENERL